MIGPRPAARLGPLPAFAAALTAAVCLATSPRAEQGSLGNIRGLADGAGPSHIFWLSGPVPGQPGVDIVGVVDPLFAAIRFFSIARAADVNAGLKGRLEVLGACALHVDFLPWRVHQFKNDVIIEGMPRPGPDGQNAVERSFKSVVLRINRTLLAGDRLAAARSAAARLDTVDWDPSAGPDCGTYWPSEMRTAVAASYIARRGRSDPKHTIILANKAQALAPSYPLTVQAWTGGQYLYSASELEPAGTTRAVQISEGGSGDDGMVRISQRILIYRGSASRPRHEMLFDQSIVRSKLGQKPLAVLPSGELLAMGRFGTDASFSIRSCGNILSLADETICPDAQRDIEMRSEAASAAVAAVGHGASSDMDVGRLGNPLRDANAMFERLRPYFTRSWSVDASRLPRQCRSPNGCPVPGQVANFVPIKGIRLSRGTFTRIGAPYAQTDDLTDVRKFVGASDRQLTSALEQVTDGSPGAPGNLNDDYDGEIGIDCSALLQIAWSGPDSVGRLSTEALQTRKNIPYRCDHRLSNASAVRPGDAIGLSVNPGISHIVLFASELKLDGANTSWLVLESSSSCDGVCWSVYDPAFFNGWGIYRAAGRKDLACPTSGRATSIAGSPIPESTNAWRTMLNKTLSVEH
jgi:hypothetical protein